jgi:fumarate reductase subunit C
MNPDYRPYHPKWHRQRMPIFWWLEKLSYAKFISRELTSLAVLYSATLLVIQVWTLARGRGTYERFSAWLESPAALALHLLVLAILVFHAITWLNLAPKALVIRLGRRRVPDAVVVGAHYAAWLGASGLVAWFLLGG